MCHRICSAMICATVKFIAAHFKDCQSISVRYNVGSLRLKLHGEKRMSYGVYIKLKFWYVKKKEVLFSFIDKFFACPLCHSKGKKTETA